MRTPSRALALLLLVPAACAKGGGTPGPDDQEGPPEVFTNASGTLTESDIRALIRGGEVELAFPVTRNEDGVLEGTLRARLIDVSKKEEPILGEGTVSVRQDSDRQTHKLVVSGLPADLARPKTSAIVIDWSASLSSGTLRGRKSLYAALGKLEVQLKGATEVPEGGAVPFRVVARDPDTLAPSSGAKVKGLFTAEGASEATLLFEGVTDARGELLASLRAPSAEAGSLRVEVAQGDVETWVSTNLTVVRERRIQLATDKTIYKPGQTIELRTLALHSTEKTPLAGLEVTFEALDGKGNKVFRSRARTDAFGVASMKVPTDTQINEGTWTFRALIDGARAEKKLPVVRYNLPKMKVAVAADREFVQPGATLRGRVSARYLFGSPVTNANVSVTAKQRDGGQVAAVSGRTDRDGLFAYELQIPQGLGGTRAEEGEAALLISADITDTAGQEESGDLALPLVKGALVIKAITEAGALIPGVENIVYLLVSDPVGRPIVANLHVTGLGPRDDIMTGADGVAELRFTPGAGSAQASIEVTATDGANRSFSRRLSLDRSEGGVVLVRTDKAVYKAGDTAVVRVIASGMNATRAYVDIYKGASGLESQALELSGGAGELRIPITQAMRGVLLLDAFTLAGSGRVLRGVGRVMVDPEDRLDVTMLSDRAQYSPGDEARVRISVKDARGQGQVAALGVTAVDEAVFALGGEPSDDVRLFFNLDGRVLPNDVRVLGQNASALFSGGDDASRERLARLLFASAKGGTVPGIEYNSIREEIPVVRQSVTAKVQRDTVLFLKTLIPLAKAGRLTMENARDLVARRASQIVDPFGQFYEATLGADFNWQQLTMKSAGPDEKKGTDDDVSFQLWYGWIFWANEADVDADGDFRNGLPGGLDDAVAERAGAGGPPMAGAPAPAPQAPNDPSNGMASGTGAKVRADFRETIYVNPTVITDASGEATISFPLADSITTWRVSAQGSTRDGKLGGSKLGFRTFQEFFVDFDVPTTLTKGDVVELPAIVYNYLGTEQSVTVALEQAPWFEALSNLTQSVTLAPSEVRSVKFSIRATRAGNGTLTLRGTAGAIGDALVREARVLPDGRPEDESVSDKLNGARTHTITVPADAVENGTRVTVTLTPGFASEAVAGTETLIREPNGCFEQTTSTAWPNTMVVQYLTTTGQLTPELRERVVPVVIRGYQRLLTFESPTGGMNWWGNNDPGNRILSAIMLWHLKDLEGVVEIDNAFKERTLTWLLQQQRGDGAWAAGDALHAGNEVLGTSEVRTTAFIAWALAHTGWADAAVAKAAGFIRANMPPETDLYATALAANAMALADPAGSTTATLFSRLDTAKVASGDGRIKWPTTAPSWTGSSGDNAAIETTGLVAYGLIKGRAFPEDAVGAVRFIVANKDAVGTWYNTQATMNALRALLAAASPQGSEAEGTLTIRVNGTELAPVAIRRSEGDIYRSVDVTQYVHAGANTVELNMAGTGEITYQISRRSYRPTQTPAPQGPFRLEVSYDVTTPEVGQAVTARVLATYTGVGRRDQVMVRVGRAPGFTPREEDLRALVASGKVTRYETRAQDVTFYLMALQGGMPRELTFRLTPTLAVTAEAPASTIYAYYEPALRAEVSPTRFTVRGAR